MKNFKKVLQLILTIVFVANIAACEKSNLQEPAREVKPLSLTISAAISLKDAMEEIKTAYLKEKYNIYLDSTSTI